LFNYSRTVGKDENSDYNYKEKYVLSRQGVGGFAFFGLGPYVEFNLGLIFKNPIGLKYTYTEGGESESMDLDLSNAGIDSVPALQFGAYFKYPFSVSGKMALSPTLGVDYELSLAGKTKQWWDDFWLRGGVELDIFLYEKAFLRVNAIYGFGIVVSRDYSYFNSEDFKSKNSHGLLLRAGLGYKL